jgi:hypothetical protein
MRVMPYVVRAILRRCRELCGLIFQEQTPLLIEPFVADFLSSACDQDLDAMPQRSTHPRLCLCECTPALRHHARTLGVRQIDAASYEVDHVVQDGSRPQELSIRLQGVAK